MMIRAKFRCLHTYHDWNGFSKAHLGPVYPQKGEGIETIDAAENQKFWEASPTGEIDLSFPQNAGTGIFKPGDYYYVDIAPWSEDSEGLPWILDEMTSTYSQLRVKLARRWDAEDALRSGDFQMGIDNQKAWPTFQGKVGTKWAIVFTRAQATDG